MSDIRQISFLHNPMYLGVFTIYSPGVLDPLLLLLLLGSPL